MMVSKTEATKLLALLDDWCSGIPIEEQRLILAVRTAIELARHALKTLEPSR